MGSEGAGVVECFDLLCPTGVPEVTVTSSLVVFRSWESTDRLPAFCPASRPMSWPPLSSSVRKVLGPEDSLIFPVQFPEKTVVGAPTMKGPHSSASLAGPESAELRGLR
jgi:hypothetical protein